MPGRAISHLRSAAAPLAAVAALGACASAEAGTIAFSCHVDGAKAIAPDTQICSAFLRKIGGVSPHLYEQINSFSATSGDAIDIDIRVMKFGSIVARVKQRKNGMVQDIPETSVDVMDRPMNLGDIDILAAEVARILKIPNA